MAWGARASRWRESVDAPGRCSGTCWRCYEGSRPLMHAQEGGGFDGWPPFSCLGTDWKSPSRCVVEIVVGRWGSPSRSIRAPVAQRGAWVRSRKIQEACVIMSSARPTHLQGCLQGIKLRVSRSAQASERFQSKRGHFEPNWNWTEVKGLALHVTLGTLYHSRSAAASLTTTRSHEPSSLANRWHLDRCTLRLRHVLRLQQVLR